MDERELLESIHGMISELRNQCYWSLAVGAEACREALQRQCDDAYRTGLIPASLDVKYRINELPRTVVYTLVARPQAEDIEIKFTQEGANQ